MSDTDLTPEALRRESVRNMSRDFLAREYAAVRAQPQSEARDAYLELLRAQHKRKGMKAPDE